MRPILLFSSICIGICLFASTVEAQCPIPEAQEIFHGNDIRTAISTSGNLFQIDESNQFQVPFTGRETPHALFAGGLWLGAFDDVGNLKVAAQMHRINDRFDFRAGPLTTVGTITPEACSNWDRVWQVARNDILMHIADYADNGQIDQPIASIFSWPGNQNPFFEEYNGFPMQDNLQFGAPYKDNNHNGTYDPQAGDYPCPTLTGFDYYPVHPMLISWCVFNDNGGPHNVTMGDPLRMEIQLTTYAYSCEDAPVLNQTLFTSYKIVNRATSIVDSIFVGQWIDPDLGCFTDDYIGSDPGRNSFFVYNEDEVDGSEGDFCPGNVKTYGQNPPAVSVTFLNRDLAAFSYFNNPAAGANPPATQDPQFGAPLEFYRILNGTWRDGTPMSSGGTGYNPQSFDTTTFAFSGDPNDTSSWAMTNVAMGIADRRIVGSVALDRMDPGAVRYVDVAYSFHRDTSRSNLGNVSHMYDRIDQLRDLYGAGVGMVCDTDPAPCTDDCVYPGDADQDGKVTIADFLNPAVTLGAMGPERFGPLAFLPLVGEDWSDINSEGVNLKHMDTNGDALIDRSDIDIVDLHFGLQAPWYVSAPDATFGEGILISPESDTMMLGENFFKVQVHFNGDGIDSLYGLVYAFEYDPKYFDVALLTQNNPLIEGVNVEQRHFTGSGRDAFVSVAVDLENRAVAPGVMQEFTFFGVDDLYLTEGIDTTYFAIKDVKAVMKDGTVVALTGDRHALYIVDGTTSTRDVAVDALRVYPNPSTGEVIIRHPEIAAGTEYRIFSITGAAVVSGLLEEKRTVLHLSPGLYHIAVMGSAIQSKRIIVLGTD